jgi:hypothetical protein
METICKHDIPWYEFGTLLATVWMQDHLFHRRPFQEDVRASQQSAGIADETRKRQNVIFPVKV